MPISLIASLSILWLTLLAAEPPPIVAKTASADRFLLQWGRRGSGPGEFDFPIGIAVNSDGDVFVTDFYNARVQRFHPDGKLVTSFAVLPNPAGIALDSDGNLYLSHFSAMRFNEEKKPDRVSVYSPQGKLLRQWGRTGSGAGEFDYPGGIAIGRSGRVYVADQTNHRVQVFDRQGKFLFKWGAYGTQEGQFGGNITPIARGGGPQFVAIDTEGRVYTTEASVGRVQQFTAEGVFLRSWGRNEDKPGDFGGSWDGRPGGMSGPIGICVGERGRLWVNAAGGRVQQFTQDGQFVRSLGGGERGSGPGQFRVPHGLAYDSHRHLLYVVDSYNHRVQKFAIGP